MIIRKNMWINIVFAMIIRKTNEFIWFLPWYIFWYLYIYIYIYLLNHTYLCNTSACTFSTALALHFDSWFLLSRVWFSHLISIRAIPKYFQQAPKLRNLHFLTYTYGPWVTGHSCTECFAPLLKLKTPSWRWLCEDPHCNTAAVNSRSGRCQITSFQVSWMSEKGLSRNQIN